jgi:hypothetical protein
MSPEKIALWKNAAHVVRKWKERGVQGFHSGEAVGLVDGTERIRVDVGEHYSVDWVKPF